MPRPERVELVKKIQDLRQSIVICYLTSLRPNVPSQMADDSVRVMFDHLLRVSQRPAKIKKLDIFLASNGGSGTVPWRLVSLFREFAKSICVLIPYRAYSAASLLALGADEIVMHPFGELGPIDPTVSNDFNPVEGPGGRRLGISVEDVRAYVNFVKSGVGITHEDELVKALEILANKVHPLALGNVERFLSQSRMIAGKILRTHMKRADDHTIKEIVENMASKLYFHGHPINRQEAKNDLKLKVVEPPMELEEAMWKLYVDFEKEFENTKVFNPTADLAAMPAPVAVPLEPKQKVYELVHAMIESEGLASRHFTERRYTQGMVMTPAGPAPQVLEEILEQEWNHSAAAPAVPLLQPSSSGSAGAPAAVPKSARTPARKPRRSKG